MKNSQFVYPFFVVFLGVALSIYLVSFPPSAKSSSQVDTEIPVKLLDVKPKTYYPRVQVYGYVESAHVRTLTAKVEGQISQLGDSFIEGGKLSEGQLIYQIDPGEYLDLVEQNKANLVIAEANLAIERGQQQQAQREYSQIDASLKQKLSKEPSSLLLRKPHLAIAKSEKAKALAALRHAKRQVEKTSLKADGIYAVTAHDVQVGDYVQSGQKLGEISHLKQVWIKVMVPVSMASQIEEGRSGEVLSSDGKSKFEAIIERVDTSLLETSQHMAIYMRPVNSQHTFRLGEFVTVNLLFAPIQDSLAVPVSLVSDNSVWVMDSNNLLTRQPVETRWQDSNTVWLQNTLSDEQHIIAHVLPTGLEGRKAVVASDKS